MGAICPACEGNRSTVFTCKAELREGVTAYTQEMAREDYGDAWDSLPTRCRDCGVVKGGLHHPGCCVAGCTICEEQRLACECDDDVLIGGDEPEPAA